MALVEDGRGGWYSICHGYVVGCILCCVVKCFEVYTGTEIFILCDRNVLPAT